MLIPAGLAAMPNTLGRPLLTRGSLMQARDALDVQQIRYEQRNGFNVKRVSGP